MSVRAILTNINDKSRHMFPCCTPKEQLPRMFNRQPTLTPCCPPESDQVIDGGGATPEEITCSIGNTISFYVLDSGLNVVSVETFTSTGDGTYNFTSLNLVQAETYYLVIEFFTVAYSSYTVTGLTQSSELTTPYGITPPYSTSPGTYITSSIIDTSTLGEFSATVDIEWLCGSINVTLPYEVTEAP